MKSLLKKIFAAKNSSSKFVTEEHAVVVQIKLASGDFGGNKEREEILLLETALETAVNESAAGEFDGNEFGECNCVLYLYGTDANALFSAIEPALRSSKFVSRFTVIKRFGKPGAKESKIEL